MIKDVCSCGKPKWSTSKRCRKCQDKWRIGKPRMPLIDRFFKYVKKTPKCWIWIGHHRPRGYGFIRIGENIEIASRVSFKLFKGDIPKGFYVCHKCDNPSCVNPKHLWVGTQKQNVLDCIKKNRRFKGVIKGMVSRPIF